MRSKRLIDEKKEWHITLFLTLLVLVTLFAMSVTKVTIMALPDVNYNTENKVVNLTEWTLKQKIGQMTITLAKNANGIFYKKLNIGGVFMYAKPSNWSFIGNTELYQTNFTTVPFFITTDLEGCISPFEAFYQSKPVRDIKTVREAFDLGVEHGKLLKELGFNMNFAPVVDLKDNIWGCRTFTGTPDEIAQKSEAYIRGLHMHGIMATSKHYPGKTMEKNDPHFFKVSSKITKEDLRPFEHSMQKDVDAIMLNHLIVSGAVDSESKPAVTSEKLTNELKQQYSGLIITDEIHMLSLTKYYNGDYDQMYTDLFKADNDMVLNLDNSVEGVYKMILTVEKAVHRGEISEERIDKSVIRILEAKGITVVH